MLLQETYFIAMATFAACGGSSYAYSIHNVNATNCRRPCGPIGVRQNVAPAVLDVVVTPPCTP